jgi:hypothetical protein
LEIATDRNRIAPLRGRCLGIYVRARVPERYEFFDEFHQDTRRTLVVA